MISEVIGKLMKKINSNKSSENNQKAFGYKLIRNNFNSLS